MHNCKATRNKLVDLALKRTDQSQVPAEFAQCAACREEFASLRNALRSTEVTMWLAEPADNFWPGYHERLRARLENNNQASNYLAPVAASGFGPWLRKLATASIPVPVPVALALLAFIGSSFFFIVYARQSSSATSSLTPPSVITRTVEVPVPQEKLVTRVVYRNIRQAQREPAAPERVDEAVDNQQLDSKPVRSLEGFKPANEAKLTIIKGSEQDEK
jgi:hypothetical protein